MSTVFPLATGPINASDVLTVEMVTPPDAPPSILIRWPGGNLPSVFAPPHRFAPAALAVIAILDQALIAFYAQTESDKR